MSDMTLLHTGGGFGGEAGAAGLGGAVGEFVGKFLGIEPEKPVAERESIIPWPVMPEQQSTPEGKANDEK